MSTICVLLPGRSQLVLATGGPAVEVNLAEIDRNSVWLDPQVYGCHLRNDLDARLDVAHPVRIGIGGDFDQNAGLVGFSL
jgi:hypothetical protein